MRDVRKLLLATENEGKQREYRELLAGIPFDLTTPREEGIALPVVEEAASYSENALAKALAYAAFSGFCCLADDSGLEVEALGGEPGVRSARYAGEGASDQERINRLLEQMSGLPPERRRARFCCVIALTEPSRPLALFEGHCWGQILLAPRGCGGFGYDPVFLLPELGLTMAELPLAVKNRVSHRAKAAQKARSFLATL